MSITVLLRWALLISSRLAWTQAFAPPYVCCKLPPRLPSSLGYSSTAMVSPDVAAIQARIEERIRLRQDPESFLQELEALNVISEPNRRPAFKGEWHVWYTNCPPPSNGQLGPFQGTASQVIPLDDPERSYQNLLAVPPGSWLTATLDGIWEEWDGNLLLSDREVEATPSPDATQDWGACHWKVTFLQLQVALLGFPIVTTQFPPHTSRIWRTTYLDDEIRIVRAGRTGRREDEVVFYTRRTPPPIT